MKQEQIEGQNGYVIPLLHTLTGSEKMVCVIAHGFGSSKQSPTAAMLCVALPACGIGAVAFDFPAHGESPVEGEALTVGNCIRDLDAVWNWAKAYAPNAKLVHFGSSFGAYITLLYLAAHPSPRRKAFLRCAAVEMPKLLHQQLAGYEGVLSKQGCLLADLHFARPVKVTQEFVDELDANDVFSLYRAGCGTLMMVHGDNDETAALADAKRFAEAFGAALVIVPGGNHALSIPGAPGQVLRLATEFFTAQQ